MKTKASNSLHYPIIIISLCALFLFYKYILQVYPSVITQQLMQEYNLTGAGLGNLAATFYYAFVIAQLFVGVLLDKYSTRWLTTVAIGVSALGLLIFAESQLLLTAQLSRCLMGVGVAFATVAYMKLASAWFPPKHYALVGGLLATAAMAGAVFGQAPLAAIVNLLGWRLALIVMAIAGLALAFAFGLVVRNKPQHYIEHAQATVTYQDILNVLKSKQNWLLTFYCGLAFSPIAIFGGLWGNPFLMQAYALSKTEAAFMVSMVFVGLGLGSPLLGLLSDRLDNRRPVMMISTFVAFIAICLVLYCHPLPSWFLASLLFIFGFALGSFMLAFTIGKESNSLALTATVIGMINASDAVLDAITEPGIGKLLDFTWDGKIVEGMHYFSLSSYHFALSILPIYLLLAILSMVWVKSK